MKLDDRISRASSVAKSKRETKKKKPNTGETLQRELIRRAYIAN